MAISHVQTSPAASANDATSITITLGSAPTAGHCLIAKISIGSSNAAIFTLPDGWAIADDTAGGTDPGGIVSYVLHRDDCTTDTSYTFGYLAFTSSGGADVVGFIDEWAGMPQGSSVDQVSSIDGTGTSMDSLATATTLLPNELWTGMLCYVRSGTSATRSISGITAGYASRGIADSTGSTAAVHLINLDKIASATGTADLAGVLSGSVDRWTATIVTFKPGVVPLPALARRQSIIVFGDSIAAGFGTSDPANLSFPMQLQNLIGSPILNIAHSGYRTDMMEPFLSDVHQANPHTLILELGTNDYRYSVPMQRFKYWYQSLTITFTPIPRLICLYVWPSPGYDNPHMMQAYNSVIKSFSRGRVVDMTRLAVGMNINAFNWHPSDIGAQAIAQACYKVFQNY